MSFYALQADRTAAMLAATPGWRRLLALRPDLDDDTAAAILGEAARIAEGVVAPLNARADRVGCRIEAGRVRTPEGYADAYRQLGEGGWLAMDAPEAHGGQGLPVTLQAACQPLFERACIAFMMAAGSAHAAVQLLHEVADADTAAEWIPRLATGEWAATICISEPDAGSDVGRIRTRAARAGDGWTVTGEKIWISFGDHDMTPRIGHCLLARTGDAPGTRGLSLFLVPNTRVDGSANAITVQRIEEKLGLHGSPTCALAFEGAEAVLLGAEGRGLPQLFAMIEMMRLSTACQGLGVASGACDTARAYAAERRQGGDPAAPAVPILAHADVRRQILDMEARTEVLRLAILELATAMDLARCEPDPAVAADHAAFAAWMLPLAKNFGGETGFDVASRAIQVLGGAGYTREWPVEQALRDTRIVSIYEGTTGMQALDFLTRRLWRDEGRGLALFLARAHAEIAAAQPQQAEAATALADLLGRFERLSSEMMALRNDPRAGELASDGYLRAAWCALTGWMALRLAAPSLPTPLAGLSAWRLAGLAAEFEAHAARCRLPAALADAPFAAG
ncbi:acyl-CoA dehydrogenase family protein [Polymorphum gilvum]|uniref:Acyl-CoA dehydrogenase n=1 Tax=Polymorphum gilvum (strain LMG 25793 / CGMCC 1.9160 / SL003B-26A1) TaxID=991905 RepID=F2J6C1_POLGS|nr:acyl-CoA dehydrogenase family protein [Polymorphum gilvum]ADZ71295.1 Acyl-CoA dehydrogenase [Polymorphum gilvum SL003B-26A1]